jgi:hypothetical protein
MISDEMDLPGGGDVLSGVVASSRFAIALALTSIPAAPA